MTTFDARTAASSIRVRFQCAYQSITRTPSGRAERSGEHGVDRAHVREHRIRAWPARELCKRRLSNRGPRPTRSGDAKSRTRQFAGSAPATAVSARTTTSSHRAASAGIFATVAPRIGSAGSTRWVTKTSRTP